MSKPPKYKPFARTATGVVVRVIRHGHTANGNPTMSIVLSNPYDLSIERQKTYRIASDAGLVYAIENPEYRDTVHVFDVTAVGRISGYTRTLAEHAALSGAGA